MLSSEDLAGLEQHWMDVIHFGGLLYICDRQGIPTAPIRHAFEARGLCGAYETFGYELVRSQTESQRTDLYRQEGVEP